MHYIIQEARTYALCIESRHSPLLLGIKFSSKEKKKLWQIFGYITYGIKAVDTTLGL